MIAFPKPQSGVDPMTGAPTPVDPSGELADLGLRAPEDDLTGLAVTPCDQSSRP